MDNSCAVSHLGGFLCGIASVSGGIREFDSNAILIDCEGVKDKLEISLRGLFLPDAVFSNLSISLLPSGLRELELDIQDHLYVNPVGNKVSDFSFVDLRRFLSFRVMDMIDVIVEGYDNPIIHKVEAKSLGEGSFCLFYCASFGAHTLVMQFLHNEAKGN